MDRYSYLVSKLEAAHNQKDFAVYWEIDLYNDGAWVPTYSAKSKEEARDLWKFTQRCNYIARCREIRDLNSGNRWID